MTIDPGLPVALAVVILLALTIAVYRVGDLLPSTEGGQTHLSADGPYPIHRFA